MMKGENSIMDKIYIEELECFGYHGVLAEEKKLGQKFIISATLYLDTSEAKNEDDCDFTVNYALVCQDIEEIVSGKTFNLIETLASKIAETIILKYNRIVKIEIRVDKPNAPINYSFKSVAVSTEREWHKVYIALGANMGNPKANIAEALTALRKSEHIKNIKESKLIKTRAYGVTNQPDFLNGAIYLETILTPEELLRLTSSIEIDLKRTREIHWGPRTIDLDIIFFDDEIINTEKLVIPHPEMHRRDFVLEPICELNPNFIHPVYRMKVVDLLEKLRAEETYYRTC